MPRVTKSVTAKAKHKKVLSATKGHYGARSRLFKTAKQSNIKSLQYAFRDRKNRKRSFRALWISRINAGARELGVSYSKLINSLMVKNIKIDRKILSEIAVTDPSSFKKIVEIALTK
jgi:large subunit ribosomal protein L20